MRSVDSGLALAERPAAGGTAVDGATLVELFQAQVARAPAAEALVHGRERLGYGELNRRANRLAHLLRARGIGPEVRVAVLLERSPRLVTTLLAILKAGGAYVPLDPAWPRERTAFLLDDAGAALLVSAGALAPQLPGAPGELLDLDREEAALAAQPATDLPGLPDPRTLAYLLYTSGSTGRPKGVAVEHRCAANLVRWAAGLFAPEEIASVLASTSICFDLSVFELFVPLCLGGTVVLAGNLLELPLLPAADEITFVNTVPSLLAELLRQGPLPSSVRTVGLAGEPLRRELCDRLYQQPSVAAVLNLYGPTEATTYATVSHVARGEASPPCIGRSIRGIRMYVLDGELRPLSVGEPGELFLAGEGVARGYLGRPDQTAAVFLPSLFSGTWERPPGARMYRTGDLVRWRPDGQVDFLGRTDDQVKVRGLRIEPGEIESALDRHPGVRHSAVVAREDRAGDKRLVAYVVAEPGSPPTARGLLQHLAGSLPPHLVPEDYVFLDAIPLTPSGKLDRRALPAPAQAAPHARVAPRDPVEETVAAVCSEILGGVEVGATDDFFALGGNSIHSTMVLARIGRTFGVSLPAHTMFVERTVAGLARAVSAGQGTAGAGYPPRRLERRRQRVWLSERGEVLEEATEGAALREGCLLPASFAQRRMWFLERLAPGTAVHTVAGTLELAGPCELGRLHGALAGVAARHEPLRTTFATRQGEPLQLVAPDPSVPLPLVDLGDLPPEERQAEAARLTAASAALPWDLGRGPLLRAWLLQLGASEHRLLLALHHAVADAWSLEVLVRELAALYRTGAGEPVALPELAVRYADYTQWQHDFAATESSAKQLAYWRQRLQGAPPSLELPTDRVRQERPVARAGFCPVSLPPAAEAALGALAREEGATRFMGLCAVFVALLSRLTGETDVTLGIPVSARSLLELEPLIGLFVNTLVLRIEAAPELGLRELVRRVQRSTLEALAHQDVPFERLVEELQPGRSLAQEPLVQVLFALGQSASPVQVPGGPRLRWADSPVADLGFDLVLDLKEGADGVQGVFQYRTDLFDAATVHRLAAQLATLAEDAVRSPDAPLAGLAVLPAGERHALLHEWSRSLESPALPALAHAAFLARAAAAPGAVALEFPGGRLTYGELAARVECWSAGLRRLEVGPERVVGIFLERSPEAVTAFLAVLAAGGAFLPLDPAYPRERLAWMLADSGAGLVVTRRGLTGDLPDLGQTAARIALVETLESAEPAPAPATGSLAAPELLAYVIYTSGSTGRPKGVGVPHLGVAPMAKALTRAYDIGEDSRLLQVAPLSFDASVAEILPVLSAGGTLVLAEPAALLPGPDLIETLERLRVTNLTLVPSALAALPLAELPALRSLVVAGEACPADLPGRWASPGRRFTDAYGPTEATVWAAGGRVEGGGRKPTLGRAVADSRLYVLDRRGEPVPIGAAGELFLGGLGVARGYLNRPALTAERFLPDAWSGEPGARLYRTGDRVRFLADGRLDFLGRVDEQVKVRGFRVEPGEIEALLRTAPDVREAAVVARPDPGGGGSSLVAYVSGNAGAAALRCWLKERLPAYLVPAAVVLLPELPRTPNGKLDRRALPAALPGAGAGDEGAPLQGALQELLAELWSELLGVPRVGPHDDFFDLGGHSLLATRLASQVRRLLGVDLQVRTVFEAPTLARLARRIEEAHHAAAGPEPPPLVRVPRDRRLPLTFGQERLWFLHRLEPGSPAYNLPVVFDVRGPLDAGALARAVAGVAARHEVLRTTYAEAGSAAVQIVHPPLQPGLPLVDLTGLAPERQAAARDLVTAAEARRPFDLSGGPVWRPLLLRLAEGGHRLLLTVHHIAADAWSIGVLTAELQALYAACRHGRAAALPKPAVQVADFAAWQRAWLQGAALDELLTRWTARLAGAPTVLDLPADRPRPPARSDRGFVRPARLSAALAGSLRELGRREGATPYMVLLAALAALLGRWTGQRDFLVGTPIAGRNRADLEGLIGFFVNTLALRCDLRGGVLSFGELLARVREECLAAHAVQDLPFEKLVERLQPQRDPSRNPLFQVLFVLQNAPAIGAAGPEGLPLEPVDVETGTAKLDLTLEAVPAGEGFRLLFEASADLFDAATIERMAGHFQRLLADAAERPRERLGGLSLLSAAEGHQLLGEWSDTAADYGSLRCLHQLVEAQVDRTPDAVAVVFAGQCLTYGELDRQANRLAHRLLRLGVQPDSPVGVCAERSLELEIALLAILKAGAAYVPLDPEYPRERLAFMLEDALGGLAAPVLLTQSRLLPVLPAMRARTVLLDELPGEEPSHRPAVLAHLDQAAYLIYTSGSTGRPKGVINSHRGIANRLLWMQETYRLDGSDVVLQKTPASFDVSVWEFFWPLLTGARLVMALPGGHRDPVYLAREIAAEGVTTLHFVPSMLSLFLAAPEVERCTSLRRVVCSGEALPHELQQRFEARHDCRLENLYGPTEAAVDVTYWTCRRGGPPVVPIGRPVANTRIHLLDADVHPVPIGVPGELHIGGVQLARGYWCRPELTAERFVPDPCSEEPGSRLYKTGDLARHRPDGAVEYLGRLDYQVKVRGVRVELGEIEAVLAEHPEVREAVVAARGTGGDTRLVAWVVPAATAADTTPDRRRLRADLRARLPEPMVPAAWVFLAAMPLTPSGKVDRRALPEPGEEPRGTDAPFVAPRTPVEEVVADLWSDVLGIEAVGAWDDFFALGGHSLLAARVASRLGAAFGMEIPLKRLLEAPMVAALAEVVEAARREGGAAPAIPPIEPAPRDGSQPLPLSFAQERLWFLDRLVPGLPVYNLPVLFALTGPLDAEVLCRACGEIARRHEALRTTFAEGPFQVVAPPAPLPLPRIDLSGLAETRRAGAARALVAELARRPFDLSFGPLVRLFLLRLAGEEHHLLLVAHHIVCDGWSLEVLATEIASLYRASLAGAPPPLAELPIQYADFAVWQRRWLCGETLEIPLRFWRERLRDLPEVLDLPLDRPRPPLPSFRGGVRSRALPAALATGLKRLGRREGATFFMTVLAGCAAFLHRLTGQVDLPVGTPVANRDRPEIEPLIGLFVNSLVLRCDAAGDPPLSRLVERVRETALAAYAHQELPFERLVAELLPRRELSHTPLFQVALLVETARERELAPGLLLRELPVDNGTAKFDLTFHLLAGAEDLTVSVEYNGDLFDPATAERLLARWAVLLEGAAADPARPLSDLPLLPPEEAWQVLGEWSQAPGSPLPPACVHELFADQAARTPEAVALVAAGAATTYRELDARANRLAQHLRALGVSPEVPVGVILERSPELVTALLAVLKAGGAYVPLDPSYPQARLASLIADAGVRALVTTAALLAGLPELPADLPVLCLDRKTAAPAASAVSPSAAAAGPEQLAYILFTSGSTGRPKGVAVPHRAIVRLVLGDERARSGPEETFLQFAPASFDASTLEIWGPLLTGGRLVLAPPGPLSVDELAGVVAAGGVTTLWLTAGLFHQMVDESLERLRGLRRLLAGGDVLSPAHCRRALAALPGAMLINGYGPTENTTFTCCHPMDGPEEVGPSVSIGRPIPWTSVWVVDRSVRPVPIGVPGELVTGGSGLARGYHGRPGPTAERFIPDPLSGESGARLYRTGDLVRWRTDGALEFLGRLDRQMKIRGFRIEPGEIEGALAEHPSVRAAAVMPCPHPSGEPSLVAWVEPAGAVAPSAEELRRFLAERLPGFMIPAAFQILPVLPLGPTGKVDRAALPAPDWAAPIREEARRAPRTPLEELVTGIWAEVLGRDGLGLDEDVFSLGAHSLLATRVVSRLRAALGMNVPLRHLFENPTVATLAAALEEDLRKGAPPLPPITPAPRGGPLPLSFGQQRLWFLDQLAPGNPTFNIPLPARVSGPLDAAALAWSLAEVVRRHEVLRTTFTQWAGKILQVVAPPSPATAPLPLVDLQGLPEAAREDEARRLAAADGRRPFDLARGPLLRAALVRLAPEISWFLLCLHHIAADGWSVDVLLAELGACYEACLAGRPSPLPPLPVQYADYAAWQRRALQGETLGHCLDYWRSRLGGTLPVLDLAPARPAPAGMVRRGDLLSSRLPAALGEALRRLARQEGATLYMVLLAAFGELLRRWAGTADLLVGTPAARRDLPEIEPLIGFFVDTLVLRLDAAGDPAFRALVGRVRETALGAYAHAGLPFDKLVEELQPQRAAGASPLFQVMFALHTPRQEEWALGAARLAPVEIHNGTSQFDWTFYVVDSAGELTVLLEYDRDRFDAATARQALAQYGELLEAAVADPERPVSALTPGAVPPRPQVPAAPPPAPAPGAERTHRKSRIAEMRGQLTPEQRELLERRLKGKSAPVASDRADRISLVSLEPAGDRPPLVCVHPAGGDVLCFRGLARHLGPGQPVLGLQSRGLVEGQEPQESLPEMAASYIGELQKARPDGPYLLCGWSLGGLVAYEMALQLQARGAAVALLALLDSVPRLLVPDVQEMEDEKDDTPWLMDIADYVEAMAGKSLKLTRDELRAMGDPEERLRRFTERLAAAGMLPPGGTVEHLRRLLRVFRANVRAGRRYVPVPYPGRVTLFRACDAPANEGDPTLGWGALSAQVNVEDAPGSHLTLLAEPQVQALAARLRASIDAVLAEAGSR